MSKYLDMYVTHAKEGLQNLGDKLLQLEKTPDDPEIINECFRLAHTMKGMSRTMLFEKTGEIAHSMESILDGIRSKHLEAAPNVIDLLFQCVDAMEMMTDNVKEKKPEPEVTDLMVLIQRQLELIPTEENGEPEVVQEKIPEKEKKAEKKDVKKVEKKVEIEHAKAEVIPEEEVSMDKKKGRTMVIKIKLIQDIDMPSARAILAIKKLEKLGRIIDTNPSIDDIEAEKFGRTFSVSIDSTVDDKSIIKDLSRLKGIQKVIIQEEKAEKIMEKTTASSIPKKSISEIASVRVKMDRLDDLLDTVGELVINKISLLDQSKNINHPKIEESLRVLDRLTGELQYNVLRIRMVPIDTVFSRFPRMIRDLSKEMGKDIDFIMEGHEIELDRTVIDKLGDLLVHLLRNSIDHGIEKPVERVKLGKLPTGTLRLSAAQEQNRVIIKVEDDGRGADPEKIKKKALEKGLYTEEELRNMPDEGIIEILAQPGFSTSEKVTEISGRGVGLDAVKTGVEALGGQLSFESEPGHGMKIVIRLPLTLAIILAMLVKIGNEIYAISIDPIAETISIKETDIKKIGGMRVVKYRGEIVPLIYLSEILDASEKSLGNEVIIVEMMGQKRSGIVVEELLGQQEIVVKPLDKHLRKVPFLGGATILGSGEVALILDMHGLANYARERMRVATASVNEKEENTGGETNA